jgi:hypothetical protein
MARKKSAAQAAAQPTDAQIEQGMIEAHHAEVGRQLAALPPNPITGSPDPAVSFDPAALESLPPSESGSPTRTGRERPPGPGRGWTERYDQPVAYRRFGLKDRNGGEHILFQVNLPAGQATPPAEVVEAFRAHKYWKDGEPYGLAEDARNNDESYSTGLTFGTNKKFPKAWVLPATEFGREVADSLDRALAAVARKLEGHGPAPSA